MDVYLAVYLKKRVASKCWRLQLRHCVSNLNVPSSAPRLNGLSGSGSVKGPPARSSGPSERKHGQKSWKLNVILPAPN